MNKAETSDPGEHPLLGPPALLQGEDPAIYHQFLTDISSAVKPADILDEILARDYVDLAFDVLRLRRLKAQLINASAHKGLFETLVPLVGNSQAKILADGWAARNPERVEDVDKVLASAGLTMDTVLAQTLSLKLDEVERIEHLIAVAEARRNAALREIERRRQTLGQRLRPVPEQLEDNQTRMIESTPIQGSGGPWYDRKK
jgi:hypothetical protein